MEENQFIEVMRKHSDEKLLEILNVKRKDYVADAITAAEEVLIERGVSFTKIQNEKIMKRQQMKCYFKCCLFSLLPSLLNQSMLILLS